MPTLWFGLLPRGIALVEALGAIRCGAVCFPARRAIEVGAGGVHRHLFLRGTEGTTAEEF